MKKGFLKKFIGDKALYGLVLSVAVPMIIQNGISNFVGLLDNIMIGRVGTEQMSGVSIVNQILMVYYLCIFGAVSGAGIFTAQFFGQKNNEGIRNTMRFKLWIGTLLTIFVILLAIFAGEPLISLYLMGGTDAAEDVAVAKATLGYGRQYLLILLWGLIPNMITQCYASTLRECGETVVPMRASIVAVFVNLALNYVLIYGKFGFPALGVAGAALATVISRYVEVAIVVAWTHSHKEKAEFARGLYSTLFIPRELTAKIIKTGTPLLVNETMWAAGMAMLTQCYSVRGLDVMASLSIANTIINLFNVVLIAAGESVAIIIGQILGTGDMERARDTDRKIIAFSVACCCVVAVVMFVIAPFFPNLYNTTAGTKEIAEHFIMISALFMAQNSLLNTLYFTIRAGGNTLIAFFFDSMFVWVVNVPVAYTLSRFTPLSVELIYTAVLFSDIIKVIIGLVLVKKGVWLNNLVAEKSGTA